MIARLRSMCSRRTHALLLTTAMLLAALFAASASFGEWRIYPPAKAEQAIVSQGTQLLPLPPAASDPSIRSISPRRYLIGTLSNDTAQQETIAIYAFPTEADRAKGEAQLRALFAAGGGLPPVVYDRGNILVLYRPLAIVNQTGTKYGDLLRSALASL